MNEFSLTMLFPDWHYLLIGPLSSAQGITALFCLVLGGLFAYEMLTFTRKAFQVKRHVDFLSQTLGNIQADQLVQQRMQIMQQMDTQPVCGALWREFNQTLMESTEVVNKKLFGTVDATYLFNTHSLAREITENRHLVAIPAYLTAIGVLGTFAGLTLGLAGLGDLGGGDTEHLKTSIANMIHAASIAFTTSFWGVLSSVVFNAVEKITDGRIRANISGLQDQINQLFPKLTAERLLMDIARHSKSSDTTMLGLAQKIGEQMQKAMHSMRDESSSKMAAALQESLAPAINKLVDTASGLAHQQMTSSEGALENLVQNFMDKFGAAGEAQGDMLRSSSSHLQSLLEGMKREYDTSRKQADQLDEKRHGMLQDTLQQLVGQFQTYQAAGEQNTQTAQGVVAKTEDLTASVQTISQNLLEFTEMIGEIATQLHHSATEIKEGNTELARTSRELAKSSEVMSGAITDASQANATVSQTNMVTGQKLQELLEKVETSRASAEDISAQIRAAAEAGQQTFVSLQEHQKGYRDALNQHVQELEEKLSGMLAKHLEVVQEKTHQRMQAWDKETNNYTTAMQGIVHVMQELVDDIESHRA